MATAPSGKGTAKKSKKKGKGGKRKNKGRFSQFMKNHALKAVTTSTVFVASEGANAVAQSYRKDGAPLPTYAKAGVTALVGGAIGGGLMLADATKDTGYVTLAATGVKIFIDMIPAFRGAGNWIGEKAGKKDPALTDETSRSKEVATGSGGVNDDWDNV